MKKTTTVSSITNKTQKTSPPSNPDLIRQCWDCINYDKEESFSNNCLVYGVIVKGRSLAKWNHRLICPKFIIREPLKK